MNGTARDRAALAVLGGLLVLATGCEIAGTGGEEGQFTFHDRTRGPGEFVQTDQQVDRAAAAGGLLHLGVRADGANVRPDDVTTSAPAVLKVEKLLEDGILLRAGQPGLARLTVRYGKTEDSIVLHVSEVGQTLVHLYPVGELPADEPALDVSEAVLLPGARLWGFVEQRAPDGQALTGYGATPCAADAGATVDMNDESDRFTLDAPAAAGEASAVALTCGPTQVTLPLAAPEAAVALEAFDYFAGTFGPTFTAEAQQDRYIVVLARDAEARLVQGAAGEDVAVAVPEESKAYVEVVDHSDTAELSELLHTSRTVVLRFSEAGTYTLTVGWHGLTQELTFEVAQPGT